MTNEEFEQEYYPKYRRLIDAIARKIARRNDALFEDLRQAGLIKLWRLEPSRAVANEDAYIRQSLKWGMIDWLRRESPKRYESLNARLNKGSQLVADEAGEPLLLDPPERELFAMQYAALWECQEPDEPKGGL